MTQLKQIIDKHLEQCYKLHNVKIPDKCLPYLVEIAKEIHNNALDLAMKHVEVAMYDNCINYESIEKLKQP